MQTTYQELSQTILEKFTPFAFKCECGGTDSDCREARQNTYTVAQVDTVRRIAQFIAKWEEDNRGTE